MLETGHILEISKGKVRATQSALAYQSLSQLRAEHLLAPRTESTVGNFAQHYDGVDIYFLGVSPHDGSSYFAADVTALASKNSVGEEKNSVAEVEYKGARDVAPFLSGIDLEVALTGVALANWHHTHPYCARCGAPTRIEQAGFVRVCDGDGSQHHPRTDGAVIVLVKDRSDRILLGHNPLWPEKRFSTFAGFVEPGETFEQCVAREVREESSVQVSEIAYLGSQPWPFPASIMISFEATTDAPHEATPDGTEITDVRWFTRDELFAAAESGEILLPPSMAVARKMINRWFQQGSSHQLRGGESWR